MTNPKNPYFEDFAKSTNDPEAFWMKQAEQLDWFTLPEKALSTDEKGFYRWFKGGKINTSYLMLDHHVANGRGDQAALIYDSPVTDTVHTYTYRALLEEVSRFAGALQGIGLQKGDTAVIYMPMIPQAAIAMMACARIGVIHSVVFGGFAPHELAVRMDDAAPRVLITASGGIEGSKYIPYMPLVNEAIELTDCKPEHCVVYQRPEIPCELVEGRDISWNAFVADAEPADYVELDATDPLYILYTSGTTGKPKGVLRDNGGHAVALNYSMKYVYDMKPGDVFWAASDVGWVVGHSYIVYAPLIHGCTTILYEGKPIKTPDPGAFWRVIQQHGVKALFTAPTAIRAIKKTDPDGMFKKKYPLPSLKYLFLAGERCDVATYSWAKELLGVDVIDHWWQTESGWAMLANMAGYGLHPVKPGSAGMPVCGYDIRVLDSEGNELGPNEEGAVVVKLPLPPGCFPTLWNNDERFEEAYLQRYPGYYLAGDGGYRDEEGYVFITGRIDDVINVAGHRLSTSDMEEIVAAHPDVAECAVIGVNDRLKGQVPVGFVVLKQGVTTSMQEIEAALVQMVRTKVGPIACFKQVIRVNRLPKTRSGKILRKIMRFIADGKAFSVPSTIEDPASLKEIETAYKGSHMGKSLSV